MIIIDSQVHIWNSQTPERPWFSTESTMPDPFTYDALRACMKEAGVDRAVLVPPAWAGGIRSVHRLKDAAQRSLRLASAREPQSPQAMPPQHAPAARCASTNEASAGAA